MKKSLTFLGLGVVLAALLAFFLRLASAQFLQVNLNLLIILGAVGLAVVVLGLVWRMNKALLWLGGGALVGALGSFLVRLTKFEDNLTLFVLFLVVGLVVLVWGIVKRGK